MRGRARPRRVDRAAILSDAAVSRIRACEGQARARQQSGRPAQRVFRPPLSPGRLGDRGCFVRRGGEGGGASVARASMSVAIVTSRCVMPRRAPVGGTPTRRVWTLPFPTKRTSPFAGTSARSTSAWTDAEIARSGALSSGRPEASRLGGRALCRAVLTALPPEPRACASFPSPNPRRACDAAAASFWPPRFLHFGRRSEPSARP